MQEEHWQMPEWWYREKRPPTDDCYFENMSRVIFQAGLNWQVVEKKWSTIRKAFADFDINMVASFTGLDVENLMSNKGIIRNRGKIRAIVQTHKILFR